MQVKVIVVVVAAFAGAIDLWSYPYSEDEQIKIREAEREGGTWERERVREKIDYEHFKAQILRKRMGKKNAVFFATADGTLVEAQQRVVRRPPQDPFSGMTALERDAAQRRANSAARSRDYQRRMAEEAARVSYAISGKGKAARAAARLRETLEKIERDELRRKQREMKKLMEAARRYGIDLNE